MGQIALLLPFKAEKVTKFDDSNAELTVFSSTKNDYDAYFQPEYDALQAMISAAIDLKADYTTAYTNAMNLVNSAA